MKKIIAPRGGGKTTKVIDLLLEDSDRMCLVVSPQEKTLYQDMFLRRFNEINKTNTTTIGARVMTLDEYFARGVKRIGKKIILDNVERILDSIFHYEVEIITLTDKNDLGASPENFIIPLDKF